MADIRTQTVEFPTNGESGTGYLAIPEGEGPFPGVIVVQEWWGLDDHIKDVAGRFAREGFVALAPDLYHGKVTSEPDEAQKLMMSLNMPQASNELVKATEYLATRPEIAGRGIGATGFCMGGGLALTLATESEHIKAAAPFYGGARARSIRSRTCAGRSSIVVRRARRLDNRCGARKAAAGSVGERDPARDQGLPGHRPRLLQRHSRRGLQPGGI